MRPDLAWCYLVGLTALVAVPLVAAIALSFTDYSGLGAPEYTGLDNFRRLVGDANFWQALGNTGVYVAIAVPLRVGAALVFALLLHRRGRASEVGRAVAYLPTVIPDVGYALLWAWLFNPLYGPLAALAAETGLATPDWLTDPWSARVAIAVMGGFQIGEGFLIALAWRRMIPSRLFEAADLEGATPRFVLRRVTLPLMAPVLALLAARDVLLAMQLSFVPALIVTEGGPRRATTYLPGYVYDNAFRYFRLGYASAIAVAMLVVTAILAYVQYRLARRWRLV
ncbi:MAG: carbohydrate ABC transporter permease [Acidimicrobiia bacterium]